MKSPSVAIQNMQNILIQDVHNKIRYYVKLKWDNNMGSIHILTKKNKLFDKALELSNNYTKYSKKNYKIKQITIKETTSRNPHIKINTK
jgi:hypothetical protein